ncbi:MAG: hypothetical protein U1E91_05245 [Moraxella sp.]
MNQKTQVHPLTHEMGIHTRLTIRLSVLHIGRSLGMMSAEKLGNDLPNSFTMSGYGRHCATACLAHDIGNPRLGMQVSRRFEIGFFSLPSAVSQAAYPRQQINLLAYEGNAQGFRLLTRNEHHPDEGGMRLTAATLGAFMKYPYLSTPINPVGDSDSHCPHP